MKALAFALVLAASSGVAAAQEADILEMEFRLIHAMGPGDAGGGQGASMLIDLARTGERWDRVWAIDSENRFLKFFTGCITKAEVSPDRVALDMLLRMGGVARVQVDLKRQPGGVLTGTYAVTSRAGTVRGEADGLVKPSRPPLPDGFVPVKPGERPRILLRKSDLPALKAKLDTPLGRVLFEKMGGEADADAIGAGIKYQLTGRREFAEQARRYAEMQMAGQGAKYSSRTAAGRRPKEVAVAYDLCYSAWPEDFKKTVVQYLLADAADTIAGRDMGGNKHVCSNWWAKPYSALAFIGLALWGEPGDAPLAPDAEGPDADAEGTLHQFELAEWERLGRVNMDYQRIFETGRQMMYWHCREGVGTGGFRGECAHYGLKATEMPAEFAPCYRRMFGQDVSPYDDMTYLLPRLVFCHYYPEPWRAFGEDGSGAEGKPVPLDINGWSQIWGNYFTSLYPITPAKWRPAMLWAWNRQLGVTGPDGAAKMLANQDMDEHGTGYAADFFIGYPADAEARPPAESMPLTWRAPGFGYYGFRSGWRGQGEFILHVFAKAHRAGGWNGPNAGTFRLFGLGQMWNESYSGRDGWPQMENRVLLPDDKVNDNGCGRVVYDNADDAPDGSGSVTINMDDIYGGPPAGRLYSMYANIRYPAAYEDNGIRGLRAVAVDYSEKSGAPCLFVLVDRIRGGKSKLWTWNVGDPAVVANVRVSGNTFTMPKGDAVLRGTFVAPAEVKVEALIHEVTHTADGDSTEIRKIPSILATGGDEFFLIATVQHADAVPTKVMVKGTGLSAVVTVGGRRVSFDAGPPAKIVIAATD